ncbi:hypothetical protein ACWGDE_16235 [Streptomyces sp. NPDC054956]
MPDDPSRYTDSVRAYYAAQSAPPSWPPPGSYWTRAGGSSY